MQLESLADVKMAGRALTSGWLTQHPETRAELVEAMCQVVKYGTDEEMRIKAFLALVRADQADLKREEVAIKKQAVDDARRLRLLELLRQLPAGVLDQIASRDAGFIENRRAHGEPGPDGETPGVGA